MFIVNNADAQNTADQMELRHLELRSLFYIKIPERLFYGMVRDIDNNSKIKIVMDNNDEYTTLDLYNKIKEQMNAHAAYRNKKYLVETVEPADSALSIPIQLTDTLIGIVVFLIEKSYYKDTKTARLKSECQA